MRLPSPARHGSGEGGSKSGRSSGSRREAEQQGDGEVGGGGVGAQLVKYGAWAEGREPAAEQPPDPALREHRRWPTSSALPRTRPWKAGALHDRAAARGHTRTPFRPPPSPRDLRRDLAAQGRIWPKTADRGPAMEHGGGARARAERLAASFIGNARPCRLQPLAAARGERRREGGGGWRRGLPPSRPRWAT